MIEGKEVGHILLVKKNELGKVVKMWEASLLRHEVTGDFKIKRRWSHNNKDPLKWHETDWEIEGDKKFKWKIIQKTKFSKYTVESYNPFEKTPTLEDITS